MKMTASCSGTDVVVAFTGKIQAKFCTVLLYLQLARLIIHFIPPVELKI